MNRRTFLGSIGILSLISGCLEEASGMSNNNPNKGHSDETSEYEIDNNTSPTNPLQHEFEVVQSDIRSPESPLRVSISITNRTDDILIYGDQRKVVGAFLTSDEFILVPEGEHEYVFNENENVWTATKGINYNATFYTDELEPNETRRQELVLIRRPHKESPDRIPEEFHFNTSYGTEDEGTYTIKDLDCELEFSLVNR